MSQSITTNHFRSFVLAHNLTLAQVAGLLNKSLPAVKSWSSGQRLMPVNDFKLLQITMIIHSDNCTMKNKAYWQALHEKFYA